MPSPGMDETPKQIVELNESSLKKLSGQYHKPFVYPSKPPTFRADADEIIS
jgi:hypothetical protein